MPAEGQGASSQESMVQTGPHDHGYGHTEYGHPHHDSFQSSVVDDWSMEYKVGVTEPSREASEKGFQIAERKITPKYVIIKQNNGSD